MFSIQIGQNFFKFSETYKLTNNKIRVVQFPLKTSFNSLVENHIVEYEYLKGKWLPAVITNRNGRFFALSIEINNSSITVLSRESQIRVCDSQPLEKYYDNLIIELPRSLESWESSDHFNEVMSKIIEQIPKKIYYCCFIKEERKYLRFFGEKDTLKSAKILTDISIKNEVIYF